MPSTIFSESISRSVDLTRQLLTLERSGNVMAHSDQEAMLRQAEDDAARLLREVQLACLMRRRTAARKARTA